MNTHFAHLFIASTFLNISSASFDHVFNLRKYKKTGL